MNELIKQYLVPEWEKPFKRSQIYAWVAYDKKPPYLPVAVADSAAELGRMIGKNQNAIESYWCKYLKGRYKRSPYHRVKIGLLEDEYAVRQKA